MNAQAKLNFKALIATGMMLVGFGVFSCQSYEVAGNEKGSTPQNDQEANDYQRAVNRCHRTGGSRVVKIMGELKCY